jgi:hypothetical protein
MDIDLPWQVHKVDKIDYRNLMKHRVTFRKIIKRR